MPKRSRTKPTVPKPRLKRRAKKPEQDENQVAYNLVQYTEAMGSATEGKNPAAVALGRLGGLKGGKARAAKLTPDQRHKSAMKAARARWGKS